MIRGIEILWTERSVRISQKKIAIKGGVLLVLQAFSLLRLANPDSCGGSFLGDSSMYAIK